jgi:hypothetical protein
MAARRVERVSLVSLSSVCPPSLLGGAMRLPLAIQEPSINAQLVRRQWPSDPAQGQGAAKRGVLCEPQNGQIGMTRGVRREFRQLEWHSHPLRCLWALVRAVLNETGVALRLLCPGDSGDGVGVSRGRGSNEGSLEWSSSFEHSFWSGRGGMSPRKVGFPFSTTSNPSHWSNSM